MRTQSFFDDRLHFGFFCFFPPAGHEKDAEEGQFLKGRPSEEQQQQQSFEREG